jgi:hypothetical protein
MTEADVRDLLNAQTGKISWPELARHFARGVVIWVDAGQDLVKIAEQLVQDRAGEIKDLYETGALHRARDVDAQRWQKEETQFWAVVVAPWVLVQEI